MIKLLISASALLSLGTTMASADTYTVKEKRSRYVACYSRVYVPATVQVDTKGIPVRGESTSWETSASSWNQVRSPAVFIQTRTTISEDHYTLVPKSCPRR